MQVHLTNYKKHAQAIVGLMIAVIAMVFLFACTQGVNPNSIVCNAGDYALYAQAVEEILPAFSIHQSEQEPYYILNDGGVVEAFDTQAVGALATGIAKHWYPHYLATVIIALDRDQTDAAVADWQDLLATQEKVGFFNTPGDMQMLTAALSYGLEGEHYSLAKATQLLASLHDNNRLQLNSFEPPIIICYDYQAATLQASGRNMEIVIPASGTYTYEKGLLSNIKLNFPGNVDKALLGAHLRLVDGQSNLSLYPQQAAYGSAVRVSDYEHFAQTAQGVNSTVERDVLNSKNLMSIDHLEHLSAALIYIIIVTVWAASVLRRSMQKGISYAAFCTGIILNSWVLVRLIKYQVGSIQILSRYLWYSFYIFQVSLPLVLLWMAWAIDKSEKEIFPPKWWRTIAILAAALVILVFTNDLHGLVFHLDLSRPDWAINYSYGFGYYLVLFFCMLNLLIVFMMLIHKSIKSPRKKGFIFPIALFILFGICNYKYIVRDPFIYETDLTIITGLFTILMFESCIWSGLIPVNTKYIDLFTRSPLKMQIIDKAGEVAIASASAVPLNPDTLEQAIDSSPRPFSQNDSLLFANAIPGGYAIWHEDVSKLYQLHKDVQESTQMLAEANKMLVEEEKLKRSINEESAKKQLMEQLESEIAESLKQLSLMIEDLPNSQNHASESTRIALLLCYIKRRCNLFFKEKEAANMDSDELIIYINELAAIANYSDVQIATINEIIKPLAIRHAILFYDFSYAIADWAVQAGTSYIVQHLGTRGDMLTLGFLTSDKLDAFKLESRLIAAIAAVKGKIIKKDLDDMTGLSVSFPKGGGAYA